MQPKRGFPSVSGPLLAAALLLPLQPARALQPQEAAAGARLAATCTGCHGTDGRTVGTAIPALAGQPKEALLASLKAFKTGQRSATVMTQLAKGYSDTDLERIAAFFAAQQAPAAAGAPTNDRAQPAPGSGS